MNFLLSAFIVVLSGFTFAQEVVEWDFSFNRLESQVEMKATLSDGWHLYSAVYVTDGGPVQTSFLFDENKDVAMDGVVVEPNPLTEFDPNFDQIVYYFDKEVTFKQKLKVKKSVVLNGSVVYMVCNETMCLPPVEEKFEINLKK